MEKIFEFEKYKSIMRHNLKDFSLERRPRNGSNKNT